MSAIPIGRLSSSEGGELLAAARATLVALLLGGAGPPPVPRQARLNEPGMAFVTLRKGTELRGCMGSLQEGAPLYWTVIDCTVSAAQDPRFPPVVSGELPELKIVVSVIGGFREMETPDEIEIGRHGLLIEKEGRRGILLPEVASEMGLQPLAFLELVCRKAHLPRGAWKNDSLIQTFTSQIFSSDAR